MLDFYGGVILVSSEILNGVSDRRRDEKKTLTFWTSYFIYSVRKLSAGEQSLKVAEENIFRNKVGWGICGQTRSEMQTWLISLCWDLEMADSRYWLQLVMDEKNSYWPCCLWLDGEKKMEGRRRIFSWDARWALVGVLIPAITRKAQCSKRKGPTQHVQPYIRIYNRNVFCFNLIVLSSGFLALYERYDQTYGFQAE